MSSRLSSSPGEALLAVGRIRGHRGTSGELTVRVSGGDADTWDGAARVWIGESAASGQFHAVEHSRAYGDRLVLKLQNINDGNAAAALRGQEVWVLASQAPSLADGEHFVEQLVGMQVEDASGHVLGQVREVLKTAGLDLLVVDAEGTGEELLIPMATEIVLQIDEARRNIVVRPPEGLLELNRRPGDET